VHALAKVAARSAASTNPDLNDFTALPRLQHRIKELGHKRQQRRMPLATRGLTDSSSGNDEVVLRYDLWNLSGEIREEVFRDGNDQV
jgi:hypothetical protein